MTGTNLDGFPSDFYRIEPDGNKVEVTYDQLHQVRKDILLYFDENSGEPVNVLLPDGQFKLPYWKYLSFHYEKEWGESAGYKKLVEEGSLALLNGIALDLLDEPINRITKSWQHTPVEEIISYIRHYQPQTDSLNIARAYLLRSYTFIANLSEDDLDEHGMLKHFNLASVGRWFDVHIVQEYFKRTLSKYRSS